RHRRYLDRLLAHRDGEVRRPLHDAEGTAHRRRAHALLRRALVRVTRRDIEPVDVAAEAFLLLGVGDGRLEHLRDVLRDALLRELQRRERVIHATATNQVEHQAGFLRRRPDIARGGFRFDHVLSLVPELKLGPTYSVYLTAGAAAAGAAAGVAAFSDFAA